jgi:hypothetical protein
VTEFVWGVDAVAIAAAGRAMFEARSWEAVA